MSETIAGAFSFKKLPYPKDLLVSPMCGYLFRNLERTRMLMNDKINMTKMLLEQNGYILNMISEPNENELIKFGV